MADESLDDRFAEYEARVHAYATTWPEGSEAAQRALSGNRRASAEITARQMTHGMVHTRDVYKVGKMWLPERRRVQDDLVSAAAGPPSAPPARRLLAALLIGLPGSGKSSVLAPIANGLIARLGGPRTTVDADDVRVALPEYAGGLGSEVVQLETIELTYDRLMPLTSSRETNLIIDTVGDPVQLPETVEYLVAGGWDVLCLGSVVDVEVAVERAMHRALTDGRYVSPHYIRECAGRPQLTYEALAASGHPLVGRALYDLGGPPGQAPRVVDTDRPELFGAVGAEALGWRPEVDDAG